MYLRAVKILPKIFNSDKVVAAQSMRLGGVSQAPFYSMNLGKSTNDLPENVEQNRNIFFNSLGISTDRIALSKQVHGTEVAVINSPTITQGYDALITNEAQVFLAVSIADCVPVLIHDRKNNAIAAIHAGWRGTAGAIVTQALEKMRTEYNSEGKDCHAFIGACIGYDHFEVGDEVAEHFHDKLKRKNDSGKYNVDLKTANLEQLKAFGVPVSQVEIAPYCTVANNDLFFSHRFEKGVTGRMLAVIGLR